MASLIIGRTACPECDFESAHVKLKQDAAPGKEPLPYRYCPSCGAAYHPRSKAAAAALLKKTRLEDAPPTQSAPEPAKPATSSSSSEREAVPPDEDEKPAAAPAPKKPFWNLEL